MAEHPVETYLRHLAEIRYSGGAVAETSYYSALEILLNEAGRQLKPRVRCVSQVANTGAGSPDYGLYTENQFKRSRDGQPATGVLPERGVIEVKPASDDSWTRAKGKQVTQYWGHYGQVLVTNYRDFVFVGRDEHNQPVQLETFSLAASENEFWAATLQPRKLAGALGERLLEYLKRVMMHGAPLSDPAALAKILAAYAREARARIEAKGELPGLALLRRSLEEALGMKFEGANGEHFFRATLVQTLFYGIFSAWVLWAREQGASAGERFKWHEAIWTLHVPMITALFHQITDPKWLKEYRLNELLDWTERALNRVVRPEFFQRFEEEHAVQYFYEPFLKEYDPELRKDLGVWYTPPEIVQYQVARVDAVLREELAIADGLADPNVVILDPCCGTGAYLVEVLRKIHETLEAKGGHALVAQQLKQAAMKRVFGFEILPAPFVISHLQLGLLLRSLGAPLKEDGAEERAGVYLTNALTGWEPPQKPKDELPFPEMQEERDKADEIKRDTPILVVIGNPPYNAFAGTCTTEEQGLVEAYKEGLTKPVKDGGWGIKKFNLDDLYVRFFRIAERRVVKSGKGVVCYISNYSWSSEPSFVVLRKNILNSFDKIWIENLHGNRKISEYAPNGQTSETIFSIAGTSVGIQQGVTISLWVKIDNISRKNPVVLYRDDIDDAKAIDRRNSLLKSLESSDFNKNYKKSNPSIENRYSFHPENVKSEYRSWPSLIDLCSVPPSNGLMEKRGGALIDIDKDALERRMRVYFDRNINWDELVRQEHPLTHDAARYDAKKTRNKIIKGEMYDNNGLRPYSVRPFDVRWCYYTKTRPIWNEPRPTYGEQCWHGNQFLMSRFRSTASPEGMPFYYVTGLSDDHCITPDNACFPFRLAPNNHHDTHGMDDLFKQELENNEITDNLSIFSFHYLNEILNNINENRIQSASVIYLHALAIGYSPAYLEENADGIRQDWPRIPLPATKDALLASAELGRGVAGLLDTEKPVAGVTAGKIRPELRLLGRIDSLEGGQLDPGRGDLDLTAGWGHAGQGGVTMPGRGKAEERPYTAEERAALAQGAAALGLTLEEALARLGATAVDVYLNGVACWRGVPAGVWGFTIGGYQVIKKWLSYREKALLGRGLKMEEALYVTEMVRRLAALCLLQPALDANYQAVKADTYPWPAAAAMSANK